MESEKNKDQKPKNPRSTANLLTAATFSWTLPLFLKGYKRDLEVEDLYEPLKEHTSSYLGDRFEKVWNEEVKRSIGNNREPSFLRTITKVFGPKLMAYGIVIFIAEIVLRIAQPLFLGGLIDHFTPESRVSKREAYYYALGIILCSAITVFTMHPYMMGIMHIGMKVRVAACSLIYRKALKLSKTALGQTTVGQVVNLLSNDVNRFDIAFIFLHNLWIGPLQTCIVTYFLWELIGGPASIIGLISLLMFIPLQAWLGKKASSLRLRTAVRTDERVRLMNEIISGIQVIKMYTWEKPFAKLVSFARRKEINVIRKSSYIRGIMLSFIIFHTRTSIFFSILAYVLFGKDITAQKVFVVTSFYNTLRQTMTVFFPQGITQVAEALVSIKRIQKFLLYNETTVPCVSSKMNGDTGKEKDDIKKTMEQVANIIDDKNHIESVQPYGISIKGATAKWTSDQTENTLTSLNSEFIPGKLTAIIGPVGSGKTSLLHAILKELPLSEGCINVSGRVSYASQEPWLFGGSVRQNIIFGEPFDKDRYRHVVKVCALRTDFEQFPYGDKTLVGERGVSLSGGQRARINLARAVYKKADIYLLDDPLSAVDTHVGKHLFEDCITGYLKHNTVVLVTHQLQYLNNVDHIILLENGIIKAEGTYSELQQTGQDFTKLLAHHEEEEELVRRLSYSRQSSVQSVASSIDDSHIQEEPAEVAETRTKGSVSGAVYKGYLLAGGGCFLLFIMLFLSVFAQFLASAGDYWITYWVNLEEHVYHNTSMAQEYAQYYFYIAPRDVCIYVFSALTVGMIIFVLIRSYIFFFMCMRASTKLHDNMFDSITHTTMWFFNNNSSGRILNRFSKDIGSIDELLPAALIDCLQIGLTLAAIITVVALMNPWLLIPTAGAGIIFYYLRLFYLTTSRSVKRLEGVTRSPVFSHLNASLQGLTTIRAFQAQGILQREFDNHQDLHSSAWYLFIASSRAFGYSLDIVCLIYIGLVTLSFLVLDQSSFGGNVGLAITQSIGLTGMFQWGMRQSAELENQMTSVERVMEYSNLESEAPLESPQDKKPKEAWPETGKVVFSQVFLKYGPSDDWVLKNLNFTILPSEKVGIVGRTGAGKSSLISALFRLTEIKGSIIIDDVVTSTLGLHELRSKISIIPQEPVLFSGSLRKNLDPFDQYSDELLWNALEEVELKEVVSEFIGGLNAKMSEGGSNMSVGQRQLVCLARAIIRNNKILVLDEATANVDPQTDALIQTTIRKKFESCTVLTIAHRLNTVMDSDKVLVMDSGTMVEFDHPYLLLKNDEGFLYKMVQQTGKATADMLYEVAAKNYNKLSGSSELDD